ncbi:hypothetical protein Q2T94_02745 [Paeniglutamicibacter sulfureus]|uniref:hypothetical protein n=1 Tax=Paeniglutamicibacter sulfureus TaxID=43666 RepID=UPI002665DFB0|nr:hypothetical protein [Paeniglutamicibacter sulfureus]MDO2933225.1 hypothetical protein [Paeniglutamicibacter sulfureus]
MGLGKKLKAWLGQGKTVVEAEKADTALAPVEPVPARRGDGDPGSSDNQEARASNGATIKLSITMEMPLCVELAVTTTFAKKAVRSLADHRGLKERDVLECQAMLQRDPSNTADRNAVDVVVDGTRVGCLPGYLAAHFVLDAGTAVPVQYQLHILRGEDKLRAKAYVWMGDGQPEWSHDRQNPPALTARERVLETARGQSDLVKEALAEGGSRAAEFQKAMVNGVHYLQLAEPIKQLKREGRLKEALHWCYVAIESAEKGRQGSIPAPAYTREAAIVHRKLGERKEEIAVLKRWLEFCPPESRAGSDIGIRLANLEAKSAPRTKPKDQTNPKAT